MEGGLQELDETGYWIELIEEVRISKPDCTKALHAETDELIAIFVSIVKKLKSRC